MSKKNIVNVWPEFYSRAIFEEMMQLGYYDKPYIFNIENDRENRFEW